MFESCWSVLPYVSRDRNQMGKNENKIKKNTSELFSFFPPVPCYEFQQGCPSAQFR